MKLSNLNSCLYTADDEDAVHVLLPYVMQNQIRYSK